MLVRRKWLAYLFSLSICRYTTIVERGVSKAQSKICDGRDVQLDCKYASGLEFRPPLFCEKWTNASRQLHVQS